MTASSPRIFTFVSGKGGVGKTSIAANFAWVAAQSRKTVLIDMDLQNQGMTGLFEPFLEPAAVGAFELLSRPDTSTELASCLIPVEPNLQFLPAASAKIDPSALELTAVLSNPEIGRRIQHLIQRLRETSDFEVLVLDCHGGLDYLSLGAHHASDTTIVVTEADIVTFNGTLELMSFYQSVPLEAGWIVRQEGPEHPHLARLLLNRIPPRYRFADLDAVYHKVLAQHSNEYRLEPEVLAYFPNENFLMESFGEYPFCVKLAPNSVFAKKIWLMDYELNGPSPAHVLRAQKKLASASYRDKVRHCILSNEEVNSRRMLSTFGVLTGAFTLFVLFVLVPYSFSLFDTFQPVIAFMGDAYDKHIAVQLILFLLVFAAPTYVSFSLARALWGALRFYTDRYKFKRGLWAVPPRRIKMGERIILTRLLLLRWMLVFPLLLFTVVSVTLPTIWGYVTYLDVSSKQATHAANLPASARQATQAKPLGANRK